MVKYMPDVTLGNILTIVSLLGLGIGAWTSLNGRVAALETAQASDKKEVRESLADIKSSVKDLSEKVGAIDKNVAVMGATAGGKK